MKNCSRHANLSVRLFARDITPTKSVKISTLNLFARDITPTKSVKISTLNHNFLSDYCRDFSHILHICTRPEVDSLV